MKPRFPLSHRACHQRPGDDQEREPEPKRRAAMVFVPLRATTIEDLWDELADLTEQLTIDEVDTGGETADLDEGERLTLLADADDYASNIDDETISDRFVYTRFILRQSLRL